MADDTERPAGDRVSIASEIASSVMEPHVFYWLIRDFKYILAFSTFFTIFGILFVVSFLGENEKLEPAAKLAIEFGVVCVAMTSALVVRQLYSRDGDPPLPNSVVLRNIAILNMKIVAFAAAIYVLLWLTPLGNVVMCELLPVSGGMCGGFAESWLRSVVPTILAIGAFCVGRFGRDGWPQGKLTLVKENLGLLVIEFVICSLLVAVLVFTVLD